jgi:site-specific DNA recombinase
MNNSNRRAGDTGADATTTPIGRRAVIYARASTDRQDLSTKQQVAACYEYAAQHGLTVCDVYEDSGYTGTKDSRPSFQRLVTAIKAGGKRPPCDVILIWKMNRFARNRFDSAVYRQLFQRYGVAVVSITQSVGADATGQLTEAVLEALDEFYSANLAEDVKRGQYSAANAGYWMTRKPYGYRLTAVQVGEKQKTRLEVDPVEAPVVRLIFAMAAAGHTGAAIARRLNDDGIPAPGSRGRWRRGRISYILKNRTYLGESAWGARTKDASGRRRFVAADDSRIVRVAGTHPALVDEKTFGAAQAALENRRPLHPRAAASPYLLSGLLRCGYCEGKMAGASRSRYEPRGAHYRYYVCNSHDTDHSEACRHKVHIRHSELEAQVLDQIAARVLDPDTIAELVRLSNSYLDDSDQQAAERQQLEAAAAELRTAKRRLMRLVEQGGLDADADVAARLKELTAQIQQHDQRLYQLAASEAAQPPRLDVDEMTAYAESLRFLLTAADPAEAKSVLRGFIRGIVVTYPDVSITFTLPTPTPAQQLPPVLDTLLGVSGMEPKG